MNTRPENRSLPPELEALRGKIDAVDAGLVDLMSSRVALAREALALKATMGMASEDPAREAAVVRRASALARDRGMEPEIARDVLWKLMALSRGIFGNGEKR